MNSPDVANEIYDICWAFNSSKFFEEFLIKLDMLCIGLDDAEELYARCSKHFIKYMPKCVSYNKRFSFKDTFKNYKMIIDFILPSEFEIYVGNMTNSLSHCAMTTVSLDKKIVHQFLSCDSFNYNKKFNVDLVHETFNRLMHQCALYVKNGELI